MSNNWGAVHYKDGGFRAPLLQSKNCEGYLCVKVLATIAHFIVCGLTLFSGSVADISVFSLNAPITLK